jgi:hypothetical protein
MTIKGQNLEIYQGDNKNIIITVYDENGGLVTLSGYSAVWCAYKQTPFTVAIEKSTTNGITILDPSSGQLQITIEQSDTENLTPNVYAHQCEVEDAFGNHATVTTGYFSVLRSVTHPSL